MEENIQYMAVTKTGYKFKCNVKVVNIFEAAEEILQSINAGDLKIDGVPVQPEDIIKIVDIPG